MIAINIQHRLDKGGNDLQLEIVCDIAQGKITAIYGASGTGKTTLLRILAGLTTPDKGTITVNGNLWLDTNSRFLLQPQKREIGFVFQDFALFPNMTVIENLKYAAGKRNARDLISELTDVLELGALVTRYPGKLSGGEKQRVALARALVTQPKLLLLDEPMAALGNEMRRNLQEYLLEVHSKHNLTTLLVSHDIAEIYKLAEDVLILENGRIARRGSPTDLFGSSADKGKIQVTGTILEIDQVGAFLHLKLLVLAHIISIKVFAHDYQHLTTGDSFVVTTGDFNPA